MVLDLKCTADSQLGGLQDLLDGSPAPALGAARAIYVEVKNR
jgi:hypothetical protein